MWFELSSMIYSSHKPQDIWTHPVYSWYLFLQQTDDRCSDLVAAVAKGFAGHVGGQTVEDQISTGGTRGDGAVIGIEGHTSDLFFMVLGDRQRLQTVNSSPGWKVRLWKFHPSRWHTENFPYSMLYVHISVGASEIRFTWRLFAIMSSLSLTLRVRCSLLVFRSHIWTQWSRPPLTRNWDEELRHTRVCLFWGGGWEDKSHQWERWFTDSSVLHCYTDCSGILRVHMYHLNTANHLHTQTTGKNTGRSWRKLQEPPMFLYRTVPKQQHNVSYIIR